MLQTKGKKHTHAWMIGMVALLLLAAAVLSGCGNKYVATYKGGNIGQAEYDGFLGADKFYNYSQTYPQMEADPSFKEGMLKKLIAFKLLTAQATDAIKKDSETNAQTQIDQMKASFAKDATTKANYDKYLSDNKTTEADLKQYMIYRITVGNSLGAKYTDQQLQDEFNKNKKADDHFYDTAKVSHILIALKDTAGKDLRTKDQALARAKEVKDKLDKGGDFAALAKEYSDDPGSKDKGGSLGTDVALSKTVQDFVPEFKQAAIDLAVGKISDPVLSTYGYHLIKVDSKSIKTFADAKDTVKGSLIGAGFSNYMQKDLPAQIIKINLPAASAAPAAPAAT